MESASLSPGKREYVPNVNRLRLMIVRMKLENSITLPLKDQLEGKEEWISPPGLPPHHQWKENFVTYTGP